MRVQVEMPDAVWGRLASIADEQGVKVSELVGEAVEHLLRVPDAETVRALATAGYTDGEIAAHMRWSTERVRMRRNGMGVPAVRRRKVRAA